MTDLSKLCAPFPPSAVSWRVGATNGDKTKGMALAYIDARDVMERLDAVCGVAGWQCRYPHANGKTVCEIGIKIGDEWVWKADGAGDTEYEAEKGALSDAFKRAAVRWGVGRYLYDMGAPWVAIEKAGRSFKIKDSEQSRLLKILTGAAPITSGSPDAPKVDPAKMRAAKGFADAAVAFLRNVKDGPEFEAWHRENADKIARVKEYYPDLHGDICKLIEHCKNDFNPLAAE